MTEITADDFGEYWLRWYMNMENIFLDLNSHIINRIEAQERAKKNLLEFLPYEVEYLSTIFVRKDS
jgi:hypothetical protein